MTVSPFNLVGWFRDVPLKKKLTLLFAFTSAFALLAACVSLWGYEWRTYRRALLRETVTVAEMLGDSTGAALAFNDSRAASETLSVLHAEPRIAAACLYDKYGQVFASYRFHARACPDEPGPARAEFVEGRLVVVYASQLGGVPEGNLWVAADLTEMYSRLRQLALICFGVLLGALVLAVAMSSFLQRLISGPIAGLATIAGRVTEHGDYTLRAPEVSNDEIGLLVVRFNQMMDQIHQRDLALESAQEALEDRVRARTEELENEIRHRCMVERDLVAARDLAEDSNRAKSAFLANMSHELRTPLNAIIGYSELLEEDAAADGNETAASDLRRIQSAARHLLEIIQDILDLSKIEAGRMDLHMQPMSARSLVEDVSVVEPLARKNNNQLVVLPGDLDYPVEVDPIRFRQSLLNLLSNACKFTENGTVTLSVEHTRQDDQPWVNWVVRDTGPGIAPEDQSRLFRSFSQVDSSATRKHGGTGLGLAISQHFCQMMGGRITVDSAVGVGSTFAICLPVSTLESENGAPAEA